MDVARLKNQFQGMQDMIAYQLKGRDYKVGSYEHAIRMAIVDGLQYILDKFYELESKGVNRDGRESTEVQRREVET